MTLPFEIWKFLAGLGLFLYSIILVEESLRFLAGRHFKKLIRKHTNNYFKSILVGTFSTAILQSSSAVTLMLLAFVGSGVIEFSNALGIILGANLGTTFTGWIVSTFGFEFDIGKSVLPLIAIGTFIFVFFNSRKFISEWGRFFTGFGLLFFGLAFMKESLSVLQNSFNPLDFSEYNVFAFAFVGFIFTAIIQSSSATMIITLTALNANLIPLHLAAALVVGADLGTTVTVILGSMAGSPEKKRVAAAHFLFNLATGIFAMLALHPLLSLASFVVGTDRPLYSLVFFQSSFNFFGIILFWPFLGGFGRFLEKKFIPDQQETVILDIDTRHPDAALESVKMEARKFVRKAMVLNASAMTKSHEKNIIGNLFDKFKEEDYLAKYNEFKLSESTIMSYSIRLQGEALKSEQSETLAHMLSSLRNAAMSTKSIKDIKHNLDEFMNSSNDEVHATYECIVRCFQKLYQNINSHLESQPILLFETLVGSLNDAEDGYLEFIDRMNNLIKNGKISQKHISSLFNANGEIYNSNRLIILAIGDAWLNSQEAVSLQQVPPRKVNVF